MASVIFLAPIDPVHADPLQPLLEDPAISATTPFPYPCPPFFAHTYIAESTALREAGTKYVFAVCDPDGRPVGMSLLKDVDRGIAEAELGYWIGEPYKGQGRATTAAILTLAFAFETLALHAVRAVCLETNSGSIRVLEKAGFVETGRMMDQLPKWPEPRPSIRWRLSREEWHQNQASRVSGVR